MLSSYKYIQVIIDFSEKLKRDPGGLGLENWHTMKLSISFFEHLQKAKWYWSVFSLT